MGIGEFEFIEKIRQRAARGPLIKLGIGDDCSAITVPAGQHLLTSTDLLLENIHFRLDWTDLASLGQKSVAVNVSDIAAMGARPLCVYLGLGLPPGFTDEQLDQFMDGFFAALEQEQLFLTGGDTCRAQESLTIAITIQGLCPEGQQVTRSTAEVHDDLWVSGTLGDSALALARLQAGKPLSEFLAARHFRPRARAELGWQLGSHKLATAMLDLSDGLAGDLTHLLTASAVGACIDLDQLPLSEEFQKALIVDPRLLDLAICGGENYELLFSAHKHNRTRIEDLAQEFGIPLRRIGTVIADEELVFMGAEGQPYQPQLRSFDHFATPGKPLPSS